MTYIPTFTYIRTYILPGGDAAGHAGAEDGRVGAGGGGHAQDEEHPSERLSSVPKNNVSSIHIYYYCQIVF